MRVIQSLAWVVIMTAACLPGCDDGDSSDNATNNTPDFSSPGAGGAGGNGGMGGAGGNAGIDGAGGTAGSGASGGNAGMGGSAGNAGMGGSGGNAGMGGSGGTAGMGGTGGGGESTYTFCQERCTSDDQCLADHSCRNGICWPDAAGNSTCQTDTECLALFSGWTAECSTTDDCPGGAAGTQACIEFEGAGRCALIPSENLQCDTLQQDESEARAYPGGEAIVICAQNRAVCRNDVCQLPCANDSHCQSPEYPRCNVDTGQCACTQDSCMTNASMCGADGICRCTADADCTSGNVDRCLDGFCGCSSADICPDMTNHPGTSWVCEAWQGNE